MNVSFYRPRPRFYYAFRQVPRAASVSTTLFLAVQIRNRTTAMNTQDKPKTFRDWKAIMKQPYEQVWTNHDQQSKPTTGAQKPGVCGCNGEHLGGCPNAGGSFKPTTGQEWTAEKLYEAVCLKGYYNFAQELNASIAAERKAFDRIAEKARQLHIYNQKLRSQLIVQQKLWRLSSTAPSS